MVAWPPPLASTRPRPPCGELHCILEPTARLLPLAVMRITSTANPRVKQALRLRDPQDRREQGRCIIDGRRELLAAIAAGVKIQQVFFCTAWPAASTLQPTLQALGWQGAELLEVSPAVMERLAYGQRMEGVVAVAEARPRQLDQLQLARPALVAVLEGVEKPGNVGAIIRSADAAGVSAVLLADAASDVYNPNCIRASLGTVFSLPVCAASGDQVQSWLAEREFRVFAARVDADLLYTQVSLRGDVALVLGSEARGLSPHWMRPEVTGIRLPMCGRADSLNVAAAAAVLFYEALRQRTMAAGSGKRRT